MSNFPLVHGANHCGSTILGFDERVLSSTEFENSLGIERVLVRKYVCNNKECRQEQWYKFYDHFDEEKNSENAEIIHPSVHAIWRRRFNLIPVSDIVQGSSSEYPYLFGNRVVDL